MHGGVYACAGTTTPTGEKLEWPWPFGCYGSYGSEVDIYHTAHWSVKTDFCNLKNCISPRLYCFAMHAALLVSYCIATHATVPKSHATVFRETFVLKNIGV